MDIELFDPRASFVTKDVLKSFLHQNEQTIYLRSSLTKHQLIQLVDDQQQRLRLNRTPAANETRTSRRRSTPLLLPLAGGTRTSPRRRTADRSSPVLHLNLPPTGPDARLRSQSASHNPPRINEAPALSLPSPATPAYSTGDHSSTLDPAVLNSVTADLRDQGGLAKLATGELNLENIRESKGSTIEPISDSSLVANSDYQPLSDSSQDSDDHDSDQWSVIDTHDHPALKSRGFKSSTSFPAFLQETQQLPGAYPFDLAELSVTYPPFKPISDVCLIQSHDVSAALSLSSQVVNSASKLCRDFVNETLFKLHQLSIVDKPNKQVLPSTLP
ncbi:hypothetical protein PSHT_14102 [Puccinia striiformis]|uniref:Uncharacterized protein n=2 Tax=Puccinia striiformis TaxID=27350 RepID=A0A2S4UMZ3_9BASI|nr:hypothetical protein PSHT_14102 [Puccinia striiformis]POV98639.1 hypothetical protein PSTT_14325 [Puccinia striiformis]